MNAAEVHGAKNNEVHDVQNNARQVCERARVGERTVSSDLCGRRRVGEPAVLEGEACSFSPARPEPAETGSVPMAVR